MTEKEILRGALQAAARGGRFSPQTQPERMQCDAVCERGRKENLGLLMYDIQRDNFVPGIDAGWASL